MRQHPRSNDVGFHAIVLLVTSVALWLLWTPWSAQISRTSMRRFHLQSGSFFVWAAQFPIPSMYNFANRCVVEKYSPGLIDPLFAEDAEEKRYINHFPLRCVTFADGRYMHFRDASDRWITIDTTYRGRKLESRFHAKPNPDGGFELIRLSSVESNR